VRGWRGEGRERAKGRNKAAKVGRASPYTLSLISTPHREPHIALVFRFVLRSNDFLTSLINPESARGLNRLGETALMSSISRKFPVSIVKALLTANPDAVKEPDEMDDLPLHVAVNVGDEEVIKVIYEAYPDAAMIENGSCELVEGFWTA
jgi:ankyrin repeat protein